jgi:hypothetical protein
MQGSGVTIALMLRPHEQRGAMLLMTGTTTQAWLSNGRNDVPGELSESLTWERAKEIITDLTSGISPKQKRLKAQWKAEPLNIDNKLVVRLTRKLNPYTLLTIASRSDERSWVWSVDITKDIGVGSKHADGKAAWLKDAITQAETMALPMIGSVCQILQTYRPQTVDPTSVAGQKPIKTAAVPRQEPVSSFKVKSPKQTPKEKAKETSKEPAKGKEKGAATGKATRGGTSTTQVRVKGRPAQTFNPAATPAPTFVLEPPRAVAVSQPSTVGAVVQNEPDFNLTSQSKGPSDMGSASTPTAASSDVNAEKDAALMAHMSKLLSDLLG